MMLLIRTLSRSAKNVLKLTYLIEFTRVYCLLLKCHLLSNDISFLESTEERDPCGYMFPAHAVGWVWLMDLQHTLSVLIGKIIYNCTTSVNISDKEQYCSDWISGPLLKRGFEERDKLRGTKLFFISKRLFYLITNLSQYNTSSSY